MPPSTLPLASPWRCSWCRRAVRPFSTSQVQQVTGPESPRYIDIPRPVQPSRPVYPRVRGTLPVPRDIFRPQEGGVGKVTADYLDAATKEASKQEPIDPESPSAPYREWKQRMAAQRRQNFREGLVELQTRRRRTDRRVAAEQEAKRQLGRAARDAPQRDDERLTQSTPTALMQTTLQRRGALPDPNREERVAAMRARVQEKERRRSEERREALHTLYMHARKFITTEAQLDDAIEQQFGPVENPATFGHRGTSYWASKQPSSVKDKLRNTKGPEESDEDASNVTKLTDQRLRRIAEELTGGKM